ncbi:hypothetical protein N3K66_004602 [Trichothecium roseum]|uniref:Uncharacterized protein n=1 Tax=Trichothecium roseum TaxID=47278 RepID=A0ACC0V1P7_9HYPO|nr:hypothetical protein N3K66_004602 [Trichothecium roseum]
MTKDHSPMTADTGQEGFERQEEKPETCRRSIRGWQWVLTYTSMLSTTFLFALDNTIVADIQPSVLKDLGRVELLPWLGTGFALGSMAVLPWGKIYGVFDMKWIYLLNIVLFEAGSAICGAAPTMEALIVGRAIAGVGGSGMYSGTLTYVSVLTEEKEKPAYLAGSTVVWGIGSVLGPVVGGAFATNGIWRWGFYINLVVGGVFAPAYLWLIPSFDPRPSVTSHDRLRLVDWVGTCVFLAGSCALTLAISFGGIVYSFRSAATIVLWVLSGFFLCVMVCVAWYHPGVRKEDRLYLAHYLKSPILVNIQLQMFLVSGVVLSMTYYIPLYFQFGDGPLDAGVRLLPLIVSMVVFSMVNGLLMLRWRYVSPWYIGGSALVLIGSALMYTVNESTVNARLYGFMILIGAGSGCYVVAGFPIAQSRVPAREVSDAVGAVAIAQTLGMVLFLAIGGSVFQNIAVENITAALPHLSEFTARNLMAGTSSYAYKALSVADKEIVVDKVTAAMSNIWLFFTVAGGMSFLLALPLVQTKVNA